MNAEFRGKVQHIRVADAFNVTVVEPNLTPKRFVLIAVGRDENPTPHLPLLRSNTGQGCTVFAPNFDMLIAPG